MSEFNGKSIVVTGGASGIGRAAVELLAASGAHVTVADLNADAGAALVETLQEEGSGETQFVRTDVALENSVQAMIEAALARHGRIDGVINAAGVVQHWKRLHELSLAEWDFVCNINLRGMFLCLKHQIAAMLASGGGPICAISSVAASIAFAHSPEYCASKAGVTGLVRQVALDYAASGIRINSLLPGATATPLVERALRGKPPEVGNIQIPFGRMASAQELARTAVWMISDASSYMSGSTVTVDGGLSIA
jgi:NAD(P)-dependent dehydrogenase (short-subunit alcohol dehydrogenase family)